MSIAVALSAQGAGKVDTRAVTRTRTEVTRWDQWGLNFFVYQKWPHLIGRDTHGNSAHWANLARHHFELCRTRKAFVKKQQFRGVGWEDVAIDIAESNKEGFQYLQTGFYSSSSNVYCCASLPNGRIQASRVEEKEINNLSTSTRTTEKT